MTIFNSKLLVYPKKYTFNQALEQQNLPTPYVLDTYQNQVDPISLTWSDTWSLFSIIFLHPFNYHVPYFSIHILCILPFFSPQNLVQRLRSLTPRIDIVDPSLTARSFWSCSWPPTSLGRCTSPGGRSRTWRSPKRATSAQGFSRPGLKVVHVLWLYFI